MILKKFQREIGKNCLSLRNTKSNTPTAVCCKVKLKTWKLTPKQKVSFTYAPNEKLPFGFGNRWSHSLETRKRKWKTNIGSKSRKLFRIRVKCFLCAVFLLRFSATHEFFRRNFHYVFGFQIGMFSKNGVLEENSHSYGFWFDCFHSINVLCFTGNYASTSKNIGEILTPNQKANKASHFQSVYRTRGRSDIADKKRHQDTEFAASVLQTFFVLAFLVWNPILFVESSPVLPHRLFRQSCSKLTGSIMA